MKRNTFARSIAITVLTAIVVGGLFATGVFAASQVSKMKDAKGDEAPSTRFLDITSAKVKQKNDGTFVFSLKVGGPVPDPIPFDFQEWNFILDTNPDTAQPNGDPDDYNVGLRWTSAMGVHEGRLVHLAPGFPFPLESIPFEIDGATIKWFVDADQIGNPSTILWYANSRLQQFPGPESDIVPDGASNGVVVWSADGNDDDDDD